jgi:large subunit ribosomal protein L1
MESISKRMKAAYGNFNRENAMPLADAIGMIEKFPKVKFDETVELHFHLNVDLKASEQSIRGTVSLPHGTGKAVRVAVVCKGELEQQAREAGADHVGSKELIDKIANGFMEFDVVVAAPDMMRDLSRLGKILGPRGLMPTPKAGTVTQDVAKAVKELKAGKIEFKSDTHSGIHVGVGKRSFPSDKLLANAQQVIDAVNHAKPNSVKGNFFKSLVVSTTMGPGVKVAL